MRELPILFSTDMVQAILEERKLITRRLLKVKGCRWFVPDISWSLDAIKSWNKNDICLYGQVGDILYVRETWLYCLDDSMLEGMKSRNIYKASIHEDWYEAYREKSSFNKWVPSIHMPKSAARIWLQITDIKIERLQDITNVDSLLEGIYASDRGYYEDYTNYYNSFTNPRKSFFSLWRKIYGDESFESNPYVWAITFKVLSTTGKPANI